MSTNSSDENSASGGGSSVPLEDVLTVFEARDDPARPLTANDIMEELGCSRRTAHNKLEELVDRDLLATRKTGARCRVWWVPMDGSQPTELSGTGRETPESVRRVVEELDIPGQGRFSEPYRETILATVEYLHENPKARKSDFQRDIYPEYPAGYESPERWWNAIQPALEKIPEVAISEERDHIWHFLGG
jgi:hypothetical protein